MTGDEARSRSAIDYDDKIAADDLHNDLSQTACYRYFDTDDWDVVLTTLAGLAADSRPASVEERVRIGLRQRTHSLSAPTEKGVVLAADERPPVEFEEVF